MCEKEGASESDDRLLVHSYFLANERSETIILLIWFCQMFDKEMKRQGWPTIHNAEIYSLCWYVLSFTP